jgi:hypothetical protein
MECLYKFLYINVNGCSTRKVLRSMIMDSHTIGKQGTFLGTTVIYSSVLKPRNIVSTEEHSLVHLSVN